MPDLPDIGTSYTEIEGPYFKVSVRRYRSNGKVTWSQPRWRLSQDLPEYHKWARFRRHVNLPNVSTEQGIKDVLQRLNQEAARERARDREKWTRLREEREKEEERRQKARSELKKRIETIFAHYRDEYDALRPMRWAGDGNQQEQPQPFWEWVVGQLSASEARKLAEHKRELKDKHDLPRHVQLI